ncbi:MAG: CotH kinase family protein [Myxococcales bacterium]|nr:CotH kinase family protein [Myxococcales bacterium]MDD9971203.1 CotH kinase family protein [Myxococcales bacterium]
MPGRGRYAALRPACFFVVCHCVVPLGCKSIVADDDGPLPTGLSCDPQGASAIDPWTGGISYDRVDMPCLGLNMDPTHFQELSRSHRFGTGDPFRQLLGIITRDCTTGFPSAFRWYEAELEVGDQRLPRVGVRKKGFLGSVTGHGMLKPSLKLKIDKFIGGRTLGDDERVTLNNSVQDPTGVRTCLAYDLFAKAGYPAPRCNLVSLMVNGEPQGLYVHLEPIKRRFLRRNFASDNGDLYEGTLVDLTPAFLDDRAMTGGLGRWEAKTADTDRNGGPLRALVRALQAPDEGLVEALEPLLDLDRFIAFWALEWLIGHADGYASNHNNFFIYFDPSDDGRATFLPWGIDDVLGGDNEHDGLPHSYMFAELPRRLSHNPELVRRLERQMGRLLDTIWVEEEILASVDTYAEQVQRAVQDPEYAKELDALKSWILRRRDQLSGYLATGLPRGAAEPPTCFTVGLGSGLGAVQDVADGVGTFTFAF